MNSQNLPYLLAPRSVALVGASEESYFASNCLKRLQDYGYPGRLYALNPRRQEVLGVPCFPSFGALPEPVDVAVIVVRRDRCLEVLQEAGASGVKAAILVATGFAESNDGEGRPLQAGIVEFARQSGMAICGPSSLGLISVHQSFQGFCGLRSAPILSGSVGLISQSGGNSQAYMAGAARRNLGYSYVITSGNEACLEFSEYADYFLDDENTRVICGFIEGFKAPERMVSLAQKAMRLGKPIILVKVGRSQQSSRAAQAHTGALTGSDEFYDALFRQYGVIRAHHIEDMLDCASALSQTPAQRWPKGRSIGILSSSGGAATLAADLAAEAGLQLAPLSGESLHRLSEQLPAFSTVHNPLDMPGQIQRDNPRAWTTAIDSLGSQPDIDAMLVITGLPESRERTMQVVDIAQTRGKLLVISTLSPDYDPLTNESKEILRFGGVPYLPGVERGMRAIQSAAEYPRRRAELLANWDSAPIRPALPALQWAVRGQQTLNEYDSKRILREFGIPTVPERLVETPGAVPAAAVEFGFPVAVKLLSGSALHKTEHGLVALNLTSPAEVEAAVQRLIANFARSFPKGTFDGFLLQRMVKGVAELFLGVSWGDGAMPVILVGMGGIFLELIRDVSRRLAPLTPADADEMLRELRTFGLLKGWRGAAGADLEAVREALLAVSDLAVAQTGQFKHLDINPLAVMPAGGGAFVLDANFVPADS